MGTNYTSDRFRNQKISLTKPKVHKTLKNIDFLKLFPLAVTLLLPPHGYVEIYFKLFLLVYAFKYTPLGASGPKNQMFSKPEVSHKKVKIEDFA